MSPSSGESGRNPGAWGERAPLGLKLGAIWQLSGTTVYSLSQWLLLVVLARIAGPESIGIMALATAIAAPIFLGLGLNLQVILATDAVRRWAVPVCLRTRAELGFVAWTITMGVGLAMRLPSETLAVLAVVGASKVVEGQLLTRYGYYQLRGRLDLSARSQILRSGLGLAAFVVPLAITGNLLYACFGLFSAWAIVLVTWDKWQLRSLARADPAFRGNQGDDSIRGGGFRDSRLRLIRNAVPLGVNVFARSLTLSVPRLVLSSVAGLAVLGVYAALSNLVLVMTLVTSSAFASALPRLSKAYSSDDRESFWRLMRILLLGTVAVGVVALAFAVLAGPWVVGKVLGVEYVDQALLLTLVISYAIALVQGCLTQGLNAAHRFRLLAVQEVVNLTFVTAACFILVPKYAATGAAASLGVAMAVSAVWAAVALHSVFGRRSGNSLPT